MTRNLTMPFAALRQDFPKAAVAAGLNSQNPIRLFAVFLLDVSVVDEDETALAVLALLACVAHRLERGDFVN